MPVGTKLSGVNFGRSLITVLPPITDLRAMIFWGNGYDNNNTNRAPGAPAIVTPANVPVISSNYATVGQVGRTAIATPVTTAGAFTGITVTDGGSFYVMKPVITLGSGANFGNGVGSIAAGAVTGLESVTNPGSGWTNASPLAINGGNTAFFDTQITRASLLVAGYTICAVSRGSVTGNHIIASDARFSNTGFAMQLAQLDVDGFHGNTPTFSIMENGLQKTYITLPNATGWRFYAATYTGGAAGTWMVYSLTDGLTSPPFVSSLVSAAGNQQIGFGVTGNDGYAPIVAPYMTRTDVAFGMVSGTPMTLPQLQTLYASVKSIMAQRGITC